MVSNSKIGHHRTKSTKESNSSLVGSRNIYYIFLNTFIRSIYGYQIRNTDTMDKVDLSGLIDP